MIHGAVYQPPAGRSFSQVALVDEMLEGSWRVLGFCAAADASICDRVLARDKIRVEGWLRKGILAGCIDTPWEGDFPRYVWYQDENTVYEGRLVNRDQGYYKGYPLTEDKWPPEWRQ